MANFMITTTPILTGVEIKKYVGPITVNLVLGVNIFSDLAAAFTDGWGGYSNTYQSKLDLLTHDVEHRMQERALKLGCNAIVDFKLHFNEVSGKGKQMFMVTGTGTACILSFKDKDFITDNNQVSYDTVTRQYILEDYKKILKAHKKIKAKDWSTIQNLNLLELAPDLTAEYIYVKNNIKYSSYYEQEFNENFTPQYEEFLSHLNRKFVAEILYPYLDKNTDIILPLIKQYGSFSEKEIVTELEKGNVSLAVNLLNIPQEYYTKEDLNHRDKIIRMLDNLPNKGSYQFIKNGIFSKKEEEMFICPNGHKNSKEDLFCSNFDCGLNIKGLSQEEVTKINEFRGFTEALRICLS